MRYEYRITTIIFLLIGLISFTTHLGATGITIDTGDSFDTNDALLTIEGDMINKGTLQTGSGSISLDGDWTNTGTFDASGSGTVEFTGTTPSTITGTNTFFNFTCDQAGKQLSFEAGITQTIDGIWTLTGTTGNLIVLKSTNDGSQWNVNPQGTTNISFVDVKDSNNLGSTTINPPNSNDGLNNVNWFDVVDPSPTISSFSPTSGEEGDNIVITGTGFTGVTSVSFGGTEASGFTVDSDTQITAVVGSGSSGDVSVTSPKGTATKSGFIFNDDDIVISSFSPTSGETGDNVVITGTGFTGATSVSFGGTAASDFTVDSDTQITAVVGSGSSGDVSVTSSKGTAIKSGFIFNDDDIVISSFSPTSGETGDNVVITGTGFTGATSVSFGGTAASDFTVDSDTQITAVVGSGSSGDVSVTSSKGTATKSGFIFNDDDIVISSFSPTSGETGDNVVITGTGFTGATSVSFGSTAASDFTVDSDTQITAVVGSGSSGDISVTTPKGTAAKSGFIFNDDDIVVSSFSPTSGETGDNVVITGTGFTGATSVSFGGTAASDFTVDSDTQITAVVGSGSSGDVSVTSSKGTATKSGFIFGVCDPVAEFKADPVGGLEPLTVKFTDQSTCNPTSWVWDFGDGGVSNEEHPPDHEYNEGNYTVTLTVCNSEGCDDEKKINLIAVDGKPIRPNFTANPTRGRKPLTVQFDSSSSTGDPTSFFWKFGDGSTSSVANPEHEYLEANIFTPELSISNQLGETAVVTKTNLISVEGDPPVPGFEASPQNGFVPLRVQFTDRSQGNIDSWTWEFGDKGISSLQNPEHEYLNPGIYNVKLTVSGVDGIRVENKINLINIPTGEGPTAAFSAVPIKGCAPFTVTFSDTSSGGVANHIWEFGDGEISEEKDPVHKYNIIGSFNVKLTVSGANGSSVETKTGLIEVEECDNPTAGATVEIIEQVEAQLIRARSNLNGTQKMELGETSEACVTVEFKNRSSSPLTTTLTTWDFGDETEKSNNENPEHTFCGEFGDAFDVTLRVENVVGLFDTVVKKAFVEIQDRVGVNRGVVIGKVTNVSTGEGISGVSISIDSLTDQIASENTSDSGTFSITVLPGDYTISAKKEGFKEFSKEITVVASETITEDIELEKDVSSIEVVPEDVGKSLRFKEAVVTALDDEGEPVEGVRIEVTKTGRTTFVSPLEGVTDSNGEVKFRFRFGILSRDGKITFTSDKLTPVTIDQE